MTYKPEPFDLGRPPHLLAKDLIKRIEDRLWEQGVKVSLGGRHIDDASQLIRQIYDASDYAAARASAFAEAAKAICPLCKEGFYVTDSPHGWIHPHDGISADGKGLSRWHTCDASSVRALASQAEEK